MPALSYVRHEVFAQSFVHNGFNSLKAAQAAGYECQPTRAAAIRAHPAVKARIQELLEDQFDYLQVDALKVKAEIAKIAFADPRALVDAEGKLRPLHELDDDTAAAIASVDLEVNKDGDVTKKIRLHSKMDALTFLGRHFKLVGAEEDGVSALANAFIDRLNAAKKAALQPQDVEDARIIEPARLEGTTGDEVLTPLEAAPAARPDTLAQQEQDHERFW